MAWTRFSYRAFSECMLCCLYDNLPQCFQLQGGENGLLENNFLVSKRCVFICEVTCPGDQSYSQVLYPREGARICCDSLTSRF